MIFSLIKNFLFINKLTFLNYSILRILQILEVKKLKVKGSILDVGSKKSISNVTNYIITKEKIIYLNNTSNDPNDINMNLEIYPQKVEYLFNNVFLGNLINYCDDKVFVCAKENQMNYWCGTVPEHYYIQHNMSHHIIGGFFGGKCGIVSNYCELFKQYTNQLLDNEPRLYHEENIMCLMFYNHSEMFNPKYFDIWWHEFERVSGIDMEEYTKTRKSFYKVIEELN